MISRRDIGSARHLLKLRFRSSWLWVVLLSVLASLFALNNGLRWAISPAGANLSHDFVSVHDYSLLLLFAVPYLMFILMNWQSKTAEHVKIFPQSTTSRFLAEQIFYYSVVALSVVLALALTLVQQLTVSVLAESGSFDNLFLAYDFSLSFLLAAVCALFLCLAVVTSFMSLIAVLIRATRAKVSIAFVVLAILAFMASWFGFPLSLVEQLHRLNIGFVPFVFIALIIWISVFVLSLVLNKALVVDISSKTSNWARYTATTFLVFTVLFIGLGARVTLPFQLDNVFPPTATKLVVRVDDLPPDSRVIIEQPMFREYDAPDSWWEISAFEIRFDSTSGVVMGDFFDGELAGVTPSDGDFELLDEQSSPPFTGEYIIIHYLPSAFSLNNPELLAAVQPQITAELDESILRIGYSYQRNATIAYLPMWQLMQIFDKQSEQIIFNGLRQYQILPGFEAAVLEINGE